MLSRRVLVIALTQGVALLVASLVIYRFDSLPVDVARSMAFTTLLSGNLALILGNRSWTLNAWQLVHRHNTAFFGVVLGALLALLAVLYVPGLNQLLHFVPLTAPQLGLSLGAGLVTLLWVEGVKRIPI